MAATKLKEWTLARTATKGKKEENMVVVRKSSEYPQVFSFSNLKFKHVSLFVLAQTL